MPKAPVKARLRDKAVVILAKFFMVMTPFKAGLVSRTGRSVLCCARSYGLSLNPNCQGNVWESANLCVEDPLLICIMSVLD